MNERARLTASHLLVVSTLIGAVMAACGGNAPPAASPPAAPGASATPPPAAEHHAALQTSVPIVPSQMIAEVKAIGIDLTNPGDLSKMDLAKKKKLMPLFVKALGYSSCEGCHVAGDYKADTNHKRMASAMWDHFVRDLRAKGGGPLFCDSCHGGKQDLLARGDKKALSAFMHENYEEKLERANKAEHSCETCHSDPFEGKIFAKLWKIAP